ncbi:MAG: SelB C-terminal domain-containing protein, partial [Acidimicrobiales bacterium]
AGAGTVVTGTLAGGALRVDDQVEVVTPRGVLAARIRGLQAFGEAREMLEPGCRAAINLAGPGHRQVRRGDALVRPEQWFRTRVVDASLHLLPSLTRRLRSGGACFVYLGSGEHPVRLRLLAISSLGPGEDGFVRITLPVSLPLIPGDRFVLRDSGSGTTVGGGEILDVDPVLRPTRANPSRSVDRVIAERGWVETDVLERLTGIRRDADVGRWVVDPGVRLEAQRDLRGRVEASAPLGLDVAALDPRERALLEVDDAVAIAAGRAIAATDPDPFRSHPYLAALASAPFAPPAPETVGVDRGAARELVRRGLAVERDGILFAPAAVDGAARVAAVLLQASPVGFTVSDFRAALDTTRRFAMPLLSLLDEGGVTRRRGDLRVGGPLLPNGGHSNH